MEHWYSFKYGKTMTCPHISKDVQGGADPNLCPSRRIHQGPLCERRHAVRRQRRNVTKRKILTQTPISYEWAVSISPSSSSMVASGIAYIGNGKKKNTP